MEKFHAINSTLNGHLIVAWAMGLNAFMFLGRGSGLGLIGLLLGAAALAAAHVGSGAAFSGKPGLPLWYVLCAALTALSWIFFILAASL